MSGDVCRSVGTQCPGPRCSKIKPEKKASDGKKDFACSDRLFALNAKLKFYTPEQFFLGKKAEEPHKMPDFDPSSVFVTRSLLEPPDATLTSLKQEVVLMCGIQGSGKSTVAGEWLGKGAGYTVLSNDQLGGRDKTVAAMKVLYALSIRLFFGRPKKNSREKTQANFQKKLKIFSQEL